MVRLGENRYDLGLDHPGDRGEGMGCVLVCFVMFLLDDEAGWYVRPRELRRSFAGRAGGLEVSP